MLRAVQESLIAPPSRLNPDVPVELSDVVMKALARPAEERFQSAFELEKALANYVLRTARSVDDSSVSLFLQTMFREEFEAPQDAERVPDETLPPGSADDYALGDTKARPKPQTITATPVPTTPGRRGIMDDDDGPAVRTEEFTPSPAPRPRTEQMPAMKRASRKLEPLPVSEPSVVLRPSLAVLPDVSVSGTATERPTATEHEALPPEKSNAPLIGLLAVLVIGLVGAVGYVSTRPEETPVTTPDVQAVLEPEPVKEPVVALPPPAVEVDAGPLVVAAVVPEPVKPPERVTPVVVRRLGSISVKAVPYATVTIQGKSYEVTGVQKLPAPAGTYEISLSHPKRKVKQKVTVQANQTTEVSFSAN